jgi:SAM-dependent methyltransferase
MSEKATAQVTAYYEGNTRRFVRWGEGGGVGALHRGLWGAEVGSVEEAADHINVLCADALRPGLPTEATPHVVDLGCGVGGTTTRLAELLDAHATGLTISPLQVQLADDRARARGLSDRCTFRRANFLEPPELPAAHGAVAIESFVHATDAQQFFRAAANLLEPGSRLVVVDDFLNPESPASSRRDRTIDRFRRGWRIHSLLSPEHVDDIARECGFSLEENRDLTELIRLGRPRDRAIAAAVAVLGWARPLERIPAWSMLSGGDALQTCLRNRWVQYHLLAFTRR